MNEYMLIFVLMLGCFAMGAFVAAIAAFSQKPLSRRVNFLALSAPALELFHDRRTPGLSL